MTALKINFNQDASPVLDEYDSIIDDMDKRGHRFTDQERRIHLLNMINANNAYSQVIAVHDTMQKVEVQDHQENLEALEDCRRVESGICLRVHGGQRAHTHMPSKLHIRYRCRQHDVTTSPLCWTPPWPRPIVAFTSTHLSVPLLVLSSEPRPQGPRLAQEPGFRLSKPGPCL